MDKDQLMEQVVSIMQKQSELQENMQKTMDAALRGEKMNSKAAAALGNYTELHGDGSLFGSQSLERDVITAHVRPHGLAGALPIFPSVTENPRFGALTGYTATNGTEAVNPCDDNPSGFVKACNLTAQFGRLARDTQTIEFDKVMLKRNRGDFTDLILRGRVLAGSDLGNFTPSGLSEDDILNVVTKSEMVIAGVNVERTLSTQLWQGTPANNTANGGYKEFPGLDNQIATGQVDADTGTACAALDSDVKDFAFDAVDGTGRDIVEYLSMLEYFLSFNAEAMGLDPVQFAVVMRPQLWFELSAVWPCSYLSHRCNTSAGSNPIVINDNVNVSMRDAMRNGKFIDINGNRYPVFTDTGINENTNITNGNLAAGEFASSIYIVPLTIVGNFPVLYQEHVDYRAGAADTALLRGHEQFWTDDGVFSWVMEQNKWCYKLSVKTERRVILRTPHLAGRIDNVRYTPLQHLRSAYPSNPYWVDGGVSLRADETASAVWL